MENKVETFNDDNLPLGKTFLITNVLMYAELIY